VERLASIDHRYKELLELAKLRKQRLLDALSLYKLLSESDGVEQWIGEKVSYAYFLCFPCNLILLVSVYSQNLSQYNNVISSYDHQESC
jgi:hypothetical protein